MQELKSTNKRNSRRVFRYDIYCKAVNGRDTNYKRNIFFWNFWCVDYHAQAQDIVYTTSQRVRDGREDGGWRWRDIVGFTNG